MLQTVLRYKGRIIELGVEESDRSPSYRQRKGRGLYVLTARWWRPGRQEARVLLRRPSGIIAIALNEAGALVTFTRILTNWIDGVGFAAKSLPPPPPSRPSHHNPKTNRRKLLAKPHRSVDGAAVAASLVRKESQPHSVVAKGETIMSTSRRQRPNLNKNGKVGQVMHSYPGHCIVCRRSKVEVKLVHTTKSKVRLFCRRDRDVTECMRKFGYCRETGHDATTLLAYNHLRLIELLEEGNLGAEDIARAVIWAEYREIP